MRVFARASVLLLSIALSAAAAAQEVHIRIAGEVDDNLNGYHNIPIGSHFDLDVRVVLPPVAIQPGVAARYTILSPTVSLKFVNYDPGPLIVPAELQVGNNLSPGLDNISFPTPLAFADGQSLWGSVHLSTASFSGVDLAQLAGTYSQPTANGSTGFMTYESLILRPLVTTIDAPLLETRFCAPMSPNSTGQGTVLEAYARPALPSGVHLEAWNGPAGQFAYLLLGSAPLDPGMPLGQGALCLAPSSLIGRYNFSGTALDSTGQFDAEGRFINLAGNSTTGSGFDLPANLPLPGNPVLSAGQTWHFQLWHRDVGNTSNFSSGVSLTF
ncbi:MAG: hypothetical protein R3F33_11355 [Planctomycetota bacterium]